MFEGLPLKIILSLVAFGLCCLGIWRFAVYHENVGYQRAVSEYQGKVIAAQKKAQEVQTAMQKDKDTAVEEGAKREQALKIQLAIADSRYVRMRDDYAAIRAQLSGRSKAAIVTTADTAIDVFEQCSEQLRAVAQAADGHANDALTCHEAWPDGSPKD